MEPLVHTERYVVVEVSIKLETIRRLIPGVSVTGWGKLFRLFIE
jgi:hypothetical protein